MKRIIGKVLNGLVTAYAVLYAFLVVALPEVYKRHNADWYAHLGFITGLVLSAIIITWEVFFA